MGGSVGLSFRLLAIAMLLILCGCAGGSDNSGSLLPGGTAAKLQEQPDLALVAHLQNQLLQELQRLGKDPQRSASVPPAGNGNAVFWLAAAALPPDGQGEPGSSSLQFYPRLVGDYDGNGEVGISDITPLGIYFGQSVEYDDPEDHGGIAYWPSGDPDGEGRANWLRARVDGDGNGVINVADITPIAVHFQEHADGWLVEQRFSPEGEFSLLAHPGNPALPFSIRWTELAVDSIGYLLASDWPASGYLELRVQAYETASGAGGPFSSPVIFELGETGCTAALQASPANGDFPLDVLFAAVGSSVLADSYLLEFGDGASVELGSLAEFSIGHTYTSAGIYDAVLTLSCGTEQDSSSVQIMATPLPCDVELQLGAVPLDGFAPLNVLFSPLLVSGSSTSYELDFGDGTAPLQADNVAALAVQHVYESSGEFEARFTASCPDSADAVASVHISVGNTNDECSVNLSIDEDHPTVNTESSFFFLGTSGSAALLDFGDGSDVLFVNLNGVEPVLHTYSQVGSFQAVMSIMCNGETHTDTVLVFVEAVPIIHFDVSGAVYHYESNPTIGGGEPPKNPLPGVEVVITDLSSTEILGTALTDAEGEYFFDGTALGLDASMVYSVTPSEADSQSRLPLTWFPGLSIIVSPLPEMVHRCGDINLLATPV
jgi:PKD repeat protein